MFDTLTQFLKVAWLLLRVMIEVSLLAVLIYMFLNFLRGTRALPIIIGIAITTLVGFVFSVQLDLFVIEWILTKVPGLIVLALLIIFQPELRRVFAEIGVNPSRLLLSSEKDETETIDVLCEAAYNLAGKKIGALIAIERNIGMRSYIETGIQVNATLTVELLNTIFVPKTPLHDGAVVVRDGTIVSANCFFPLTQTAISRTLGTRHRAGVGVTEETDCVVIVVSEEKGWVSIAHRGRLVQDIDEERLRRHLTNYLIKQKYKKPALRSSEAETA
jgi:diadenylate cyclase